MPKLRSVIHSPRATQRRARVRARLLLPIAFVAAVASLSCASAGREVYYSAWEQVGVHKRHILRDRVEDGQEEQKEAQEQFQSAYERFQQLSGYDGGDLESLYEKLEDEYEASEKKAQAVRDRIESIEQVASDLFQEWELEIGQIQSVSLRANSEAQLRDTRSRYGQLVTAMQRAEAKMNPVLTAFKDQVLYLKHNLNARAIAALEGSVREIEDDVAALIRDIGVSIREAESFLETIDG